MIISPIMKCQDIDFTIITDYFAQCIVISGRCNSFNLEFT